MTGSAHTDSCLCCCLQPLLDVLLFTQSLSRVMGYKGQLGLYAYYVAVAWLLRTLAPPLAQMTAQESALVGSFRCEIWKGVHQQWSGCDTPLESWCKLVPARTALSKDSCALVLLARGSTCRVVVSVRDHHVMCRCCCCCLIVHRAAHQRLVAHSEEVAFNDPPGGAAEQLILNQHLSRLITFSRLSSFQRFLQQVGGEMLTAWVPWWRWCRSLNSSRS